MNFSIFKERARLNAFIRAFFSSRGFTEVETPLLVSAVLPESSIELFRTEQILPGGGRRDLFLIPSPEISMKKLLAEDSGSIFQICRSFRNSEQSGTWHNPEFTMLEWYGTESDERDNITLVKSFLSMLAEHYPNPLLKQPIWELTLEEAFLRWAGASLEKNIDHKSLFRLAEEKNLSPETDDTREVLFHRIFLSLIEPELPRNRPVILTHYPAFIKTLAAEVPGTPWSRRWELYLRGIEVANCFAEESNPDRVRRYLEEETAEKRLRSLVPFVTDSRFADETSRLPRCSGVALGVDRLLAIILQLNSIGEVIYRPL